MRFFNIVIDGLIGRGLLVLGGCWFFFVLFIIGCVVDRFVEMVDWRRCVMRVRMILEIGEVSFGSVFLFVI